MNKKQKITTTSLKKTKNTNLDSPSYEHAISYNLSPGEMQTDPFLKKLYSERDKFKDTASKLRSKKKGGMTAKTRKNKKVRNKTSKKRMSNVQLWAHKRPWKVTYRNKNGEKNIQILKNGTEKNKLLKQIKKDNLHIYGINNLTDRQIEIYKNRSAL